MLSHQNYRKRDKRKKILLAVKNEEKARDFGCLNLKKTNRRITIIDVRALSIAKALIETNSVVGIKSRSVHRTKNTILHVTGFDEVMKLKLHQLYEARNKSKLLPYKFIKSSHRYWNIVHEVAAPFVLDL